MSINLRTVGLPELNAAAVAAGILGPHEVARESVEIASDDGDGAPLAADVFHPADRPTGPALLMRTPYGRDEFSAQGISTDT